VSVGHNLTSLLCQGAIYNSKKYYGNCVRGEMELCAKQMFLGNLGVGFTYSWFYL
jgi:hypothetical protein